MLKKFIKTICAFIGIPALVLSLYVLFVLTIGSESDKKIIMGWFDMAEYYDPNAQDDDNDSEKHEIDKFEGINESKYAGYDIKSYDDTSYLALNTEYSTLPEYGLTGYSTGSLSIEYKNKMLDFYSSSVLLNDEVIYEKLYYPGDLLVDSKLYSDIVIEYAYDNQGNIEGILINNEYLERKLDNDTVSYSIDDNAYRSLRLGLNDKPLAEKILNKEFTYSYSDNYLRDSKLSKVVKSGDTITIIKNGSEVSYVFGYEYNNKRLPSKIEYSDFTLELSYLNDKITRITKDGEEYVSYILDNDLNYIGFKYNDQIYYYIYDMDGNILNIYKDTFYYHNAFGSVFVKEKTEAFLRSFIMYDNYYYDPINDVLFGEDEVVLPNEYRRIGLKHNNEKMAYSFSDELISKSDIKKDNIMAMDLFYSTIKHNVMGELERLGIEVAADVTLLTSDNKESSTIDLFTLDYNSSDMSFNNLLNGYQGFQIAYNDYGNENDVIEAESTLASLSSVRAGYYTSSFKDASRIERGKLEFAGQFIIFDYLISYECQGDGVIMFNFKENSSTNYNYALNLYDYDTNEYINYVDNTFDMEGFLKNSTSIIPGITQETYDEVTDYINELEAIAGTEVQGDLRYFDEGYYEAMANYEAGDTLDMDIFENLSEDDMITVTSDGNLTIKALPFYNNPTFIRETLKTACAIAVVGLVVVVCPSTGVILIPVIKGAVINVGIGLASKVISSAIILGAQEGLGPDFFARLPEVMNQAMVDASKSFLTDAAIGGAIAGAFAAGGVLMGKIKRAKEVHSLSKNLNLKPNNAAINDRLADYRFSFMWDDPVAASQYDDVRRLQFLINGGKDITRTVKTTSASKYILKCSRKTAGKIYTGYTGGDLDGNR